MVWLVIAVAALVGACTNGQDDGAKVAQDSGARAEDEAGSAGHDSASVAAAGSGATLSPEAQSGSDLPDLVPDLGRQIVKIATLRLEVDSFRDAFSAAVSVAETHGGFVEASTAESTSDDQDHGSLTIRVPAARFDGARRALAQLGDVDHEHVTGEDVTDQLTDIGARLRNLQAQEAAVLQLMGRATNIAETMQVQQQLFSLREQIERLAAQQAQLERAATLATIRLTLGETGVPVEGRKEPRAEGGLVDAFERAADGAIAVLAAVIIGLGYLLPLALIAGAIAGAWWLARRRVAAQRPATS